MTSQGRVLHVGLAGDGIRAASGSMVAFEGDVTFKGAGMGGGGGFRAAMKQKIAGESLSMMEVVGHGNAYLAVDALDVSVFPLDGDTLMVESEHILAVDAGMKTDVKFTGLRGMTTGQGLATTTVTGKGNVALTSHGPLIPLEVAPGMPVVVDPQAFVASRGQVSMSIVTGISWRSMVGEGSGEPFSLRFEGNGIVMIQPAER